MYDTWGAVLLAPESFHQNDSAQYFQLQSLTWYSAVYFSKCVSNVTLQKSKEESGSVSGAFEIIF